METENLLIQSGTGVRDALKRINQESGQTLFVVDVKRRVLGLLTDGDIRRGFIKGYELTDPVERFMNRAFIKAKTEALTKQQIAVYRSRNVKSIPILDRQQKLVRLLDLTAIKASIAVDVVLMAGGRGERLRPLTDRIPKPLLKVGGKAILEHNIDRLISFGVTRFFLSVNYLGSHIQKHFGDGSKKGVQIVYVEETRPLGTLGSVSLIDSYKHDHVLIMNADILTNLDFEEFFCEHLNSSSDMTIAAIPYNVDVPYAVLELERRRVVGFKEKPQLTFQSNAGIYLVRAEICKRLRRNQRLDATDLIQQLISSKKKVSAFPSPCYWLDIGRQEDYARAQDEIKYVST